MIGENCRVKLLVDRKEYAREGVCKGMDGIICDPRSIDGTWLVSFDQYGPLPELACIPVREEDLEVTHDPIEEKKRRPVENLSKEFEAQGIYQGMIGRVQGELGEDDRWEVIFEDKDGNKLPPVRIRNGYLAIVYE